MGWQFRALKDLPDLVCDSFDCGNEKINIFLSETAKRAESEGFSRVFVMTQQGLDCKPVGYYTLSNSTIAVQEMPDEYRCGFSIPSPVMLIGQFGIDNEFRRRGLSYHLLGDVYRRLYLLWKQGDAAFRAIKVDTDKDDTEAQSFWRKQNFIPCKRNTNSLFIPIKTVIKQFDT